MVGLYDLNECTELGYRERLDIYKSVGFEEVALYLDKRYNRDDENYVDIIKYARKIGLKVSQVHIDYKIANLISDDTTDEYFEYITTKLDEATELQIPYVITHASKGDTPPKITPLGLEKLCRVMKNFENKDVYLCIENVRNNKNLASILKLELNSIGVCFDVGHAHCYSNEYTLFKKLKQFIRCSHIHNNYGEDTHETPLSGEIDCKYFIKRLTKIEGASNCLECYPPRGHKLDKNAFITFVEKLYNEVKSIEK